MADVFRFLNTSTGTHFYTADASERDNTRNTLPQYTYEGNAFDVFELDSSGSNVFRFLNTETGTHFYTINAVERDHILANLPQFQFEGAQFNASTVAGDGLIPLYRFFNTQTGTHFYTASETERENVQANQPQFNFDGVAYYVQDPNTGDGSGGGGDETPAGSLTEFTGSYGQEIIRAFEFASGANLHGIGERDNDILVLDGGFTGTLNTRSIEVMRVTDSGSYDITFGEGSWVPNFLQFDPSDATPTIRLDASKAAGTSLPFGTYMTDGNAEFSTRGVQWAVQGDYTAIGTHSNDTFLIRGGTSTLTLGIGGDSINFQLDSHPFMTANGANVTVTDFEPNSDKVSLYGQATFGTHERSALEPLINSIDGGVRIDLPRDITLTLLGVNKDDLDLGQFFL